MLKGKLTSAVLIAAAILVCAAPGCAEKPVETTPSTTHTTWQETIPEMTETTTEPTTETTVDSAMLRDPFVGKWIGIIKVNNSNAFFTLVFNANGTGYQSCSGKTQKFKFADPDTVKKTIKITPESGKEYTVSYYNGENASNKTFAFSSGMVVKCQVPSVDCLRIRGTDSALTGTWVSVVETKGKKNKKTKKEETMVFRSDNIMTDKHGNAPYTIERKVDGTKVIRLLNGDIRYTIEGDTLTLETNNDDMAKEWKKK